MLKLVIRAIWRQRARVPLAAIAVAPVFSRAHHAPARREAGRWFVSASADSAAGDGSEQHPWTLAAAFAGPASLHAGDTVWIRGGTYTGDFTLMAHGAPDSLVVFRAMPNERATIDGSIEVKKPYVALWGLEVTQSALASHRISAEAKSNPDDIPGHTSAVDLFAPGTELINLDIHDARQGIGEAEGAVDALIYGCIIYHNGWDAPDRGHGHGIYSQNKTGTKRILDNIISDQYGWGIHIYGSKVASLIGYDIEGNVIYGSGSPSHRRSAPDILVGGESAASAITVRNNFTWQDHGGRTVEFGYTDKVLNGDIALADNVFIGSAEVRNWTHATVTGNVFAGPILLSLKAPGIALDQYRWDRNVIATDDSTGVVARMVFVDSTHRMSASEWTPSTHFDEHGALTRMASRKQVVLVQPNRYDPGRSTVAVVNWSSAARARVDLSSVLRHGERFEIRPVSDPYGKALAKGTYRSPIDVPLDSTSMLSAFLVLAGK